MMAIRAALLCGDPRQDFLVESKRRLRKMIMMRFLREWNGHRPDTYQLIDELQARLLIRDGIAETVDGSVPEVPHNFIMGP
jgi:hypothetical protein